MLSAWRVGGAPASPRAPALASRWTRVCFCGQQTPFGRLADTAVFGPLVPHRLGGGPRAALRRHGQRARGQPAGRPGGAAGAQDAHAHRPRTTRSSPRRCRSPRPASGDRVLVSVPGEMTVELARRTRAAALRRDGRLGPAPRGGGRLRQRVRLVPHHPRGVRGPALRGRHDGVRAGQRPLRRLGARRPGRAGSAPGRGRARALPVRPHARAAARRPGISARRAPPAASCASRARPARLQRPSVPWRGGADGLDRPLERAFVSVQRRDRRAAGARSTTTVACASSGAWTTTARRSSASPCSTPAGAAPTGPGGRRRRQAPGRAATASWSRPRATASPRGRSP